MSFVPSGSTALVVRRPASFRICRRAASFFLRYLFKRFAKRHYPPNHAWFIHVQQGITLTGPLFQHSRLYLRPMLVASLPIGKRSPRGSCFFGGRKTVLSRQGPHAYSLPFRASDVKRNFVLFCQCSSYFPPGLVPQRACICRHWTYRSYRAAAWPYAVSR